MRLKDGKRVYELNLRYLPRKSYSNNTNLTPARIIKYIETRFLVRLTQTLKKYLKSNYCGELVFQNNEKANKTANLDDSVDNTAAPNDVSFLLMN